MRELNLRSVVQRLTRRSVSVFAFLLVVAMVAILTEVALKSQAVAPSVDSDQRAALMPSELPCIDRFDSLELDEQLKTLWGAKAEGKTESEQFCHEYGVAFRRS